MYTSVDLGSNSIKIVVANFVNDKLNILASTSVKSLGIKKGIIRDKESALSSLNEAVLNINNDLGISINKVLLNFPLNQVNSSVESASIRIDKEVEGIDIQEVIKKCVRENIPKNMEVLYLEPIVFDIDDGLQVVDPKGLTTSRLGVRIATVTIEKEILYSYLELMQNAGLEVVDVTYGIVGDYYELANKEFNKKLGILVNIGTTKTEIAVFNKGILLKGTNLLIGSNKIDKDISYVYKIDKKDAITLKEKFATAAYKYADKNDSIDVENINGDKININQVEISQIVEARLTEILKSVKNEINNLTKREISYIIISGGITNMIGFPYLVDKEFNCDKIICNMISLGVRDNIYSSCTGLIKYFNYKMKFRNIKYEMFNENDIQELTSKKKKVSTKDNLINKFTSYLKN